MRRGLALDGTSRASVVGDAGNYVCALELRRASSRNLRGSDLEPPP